MVAARQVTSAPCTFTARMLRSLFITVVLCSLHSHSTAAVELVELADGSPAQLTALGNEAFMRGQFDSAIRLYQQARDADNHYFYAHYNLGLAYQERARTVTVSSDQVNLHNSLLKEARTYYLEALRLRPDHSETLCNLGIIAYRLSDFRLAVQRFQQALDQAPDDLIAAEYAYNLGTSHEALADWDSANDAYRAALKRFPEHFNSQYNLGTLLFRHYKQMAEAEQFLKQAHTIHPKRPEPLLNLAALSERNNPLQSEQLYKQALQAATDHYPQQITRTLWLRARFYHLNDIPNVATKVLMKKDLLTILEQDPDFPEANGLLGQYYEGIAEYDRAIEHLTTEVDGERFDPSSDIDLNSHYLLAIIYAQHRPNAQKALHHATKFYEVRQDARSLALRRRAAKLVEANNQSFSTAEAQ